jgi:hypothetical protein
MDCISIVLLHSTGQDNPVFLRREYLCKTARILPSDRDEDFTGLEGGTEETYCRPNYSSPPIPSKYSRL